MQIPGGQGIAHYSRLLWVNDRSAVACSDCQKSWRNKTPTIHKSRTGRIRDTTVSQSETLKITIQCGRGRQFHVRGDHAWSIPASRYEQKTKVATRDIGSTPALGNWSRLDHPEKGRWSVEGGGEKETARLCTTRVRGTCARTGCMSCMCRVRALCSAVRCVAARRGACAGVQRALGVFAVVHVVRHFLFRAVGMTRV